ncbi:MAG TPA: hypothetical protein VEM32_02770, partial [Geobacteraceae bacterium]|nr:hypothetical protein [Geobacteraceae bacterium]
MRNEIVHALFLLIRSQLLDGTLDRDATGIASTMEGAVSALDDVPDEQLRADWSTARRVATHPVLLARALGVRLIIANPSIASPSNPGGRYYEDVDPPAPDTASPMVWRLRFDGINHYDALVTEPVGLRPAAGFTLLHRESGLRYEKGTGRVILPDGTLTKPLPKGHRALMELLVQRPVTDADRGQLRMTDRSVLGQAINQLTNFFTEGGHGNWILHDDSGCHLVFPRDDTDRFQPHHVPRGTVSTQAAHAPTPILWHPTIVGLSYNPDGREVKFPDREEPVKMGGQYHGLLMERLIRATEKNPVTRTDILNDGVKDPNQNIANLRNVILDRTRRNWTILHNKLPTGWYLGHGPPPPQNQPAAAIGPEVIDVSGISADADISRIDPDTMLGLLATTIDPNVFNDFMKNPEDFDSFIEGSSSHSSPGQADPNEPSDQQVTALPPYEYLAMRWLDADGPVEVVDMSQLAVGLSLEEDDWRAYVERVPPLQRALVVWNVLRDRGLTVEKPTSRPVLPGNTQIWFTTAAGVAGAAWRVENGGYLYFDPLAGRVFPYSKNEFDAWVEEVRDQYTYVVATPVLQHPTIVGLSYKPERKGVKFPDRKEFKVDGHNHLLMKRLILATEKRPVSSATLVGDGVKNPRANIGILKQLILTKTGKDWTIKNIPGIGWFLADARAAPEYLALRWLDADGPVERPGPALEPPADADLTGSLHDDLAGSGRAGAGGLAAGALGP